MWKQASNENSKKYHTDTGIDGFRKEAIQKEKELKLIDYASSIGRLKIMKQSKLNSIKYYEK